MYMHHSPILERDVLYGSAFAVISLPVVNREAEQQATQCSCAMPTKMLTLLLLCAATLTQASRRITPEEFLAAPRSDFPCPEAVDIVPCVCSQDGLELNLDCSSVTDDTELQNVFKANFPFNNFTQLTIMAKPDDPRIGIVNLNENVFQNVTFSNIRISHTQLTFIYPTAFDKSAPRLETLVVTDNFLTIFPFDLVDYAPFLTDLRVFRNSLVHMPEMSSETLTYLEIAYNPGLQYGDHALRNLPNLEYFVANDIELSHVGENAFLYNTKLKYVDLSFNKLETLYAGSLNFQGPIEELSLDNNVIRTVEVGAITGLGTGTKMILYMHNNFVEDLAQSVWEPVFSSVTTTPVKTFVFDGNPFYCSCNILWLVTDDGYYATIAKGTICENTDTDVHDVDVDFLINNC